MATGLSLAGVRLVIADLAVRLPVLRTPSLCTCCRHYPSTAAGRNLRSCTQLYQPSPISMSGRPARRFFRGLLGVHSRCGLHTRTVTKSRPLSRGFRHFVTSMPAPVASGWSGCRVGLAPTGKRRLARRTGHDPQPSQIAIRGCGLTVAASSCSGVFLRFEAKGHVLELSDSFASTPQP